VVAVELLSTIPFPAPSSTCISYGLW
jgi:hypothetical protein